MPALRAVTTAPALRAGVVSIMGSGWTDPGDPPGRGVVARSTRMALGLAQSEASFESPRELPAPRLTSQRKDRRHRHPGLFHVLTTFPPRGTFDWTRLRPKRRGAGAAGLCPALRSICRARRYGVTWAHARLARRRGASVDKSRRTLQSDLGGAASPSEPIRRPLDACSRAGRPRRFGR